MSTDPLWTLDLGPRGLHLGIVLKGYIRQLSGPWTILSALPMHTITVTVSVIVEVTVTVTCAQPMTKIARSKTKAKIKFKTKYI